MSEDTEKLAFEQALAALEATVQRLEQGDLTLEEAIATYERGIRLAQICTNALDAAELQVIQVTPNNNQQQLGIFFEEEAG